MRGMSFLVLIWFKTLFKRFSYITFLFVSIGTFYTLNILSPLLKEVPENILMVNMLIMTTVVGVIYSIEHNPRVILSINYMPARDWRITILSLLSFLPFPTFVYISQLIDFSYLILSIFLFLGLVDISLFIIIGFIIASVLSPSYGILFLIILLIKPLPKLLPQRRIVMFWIKKRPITVINPLFLWPLGIIFIGMVFITQKVQNTKLWVSPVGGGATYFSTVAVSGDFQTLLLGGIFTSLSAILSLMLPVFFSGAGYLDNYLWSLKVLRGKFWEGFVMEILLNTIFGTAVILGAFTLLKYLGIGSFEGTALVVFLSILTVSAVGPSLDTGEFLGSYLLFYLVSVFIIGRLSMYIQQKYLIFMLLTLIFPARVVWLKLKLSRR